mgnify:CR=1 FL=1|jgi:hypothetical protein|tara:strand:- start:370 stop:579 length:210 start_codon:yes stop_codon:yes gene_type:complete
MNIGDKLFLLYTDRKTKETSCDGPATIVGFQNEPLNDEGVIVVQKLDGRTECVNLEGTSSHEIDIHLVY